MEQVWFHQYLIQYKVGDNECYMDLEVFERVGEVHSQKDVQFNPPKPIFERRGATSGMDTVEDTNEAARVVKGSIKWDGCSNITLFPDEEGFVHFCGKDGAAMYGKLLEELYDIAAAYIPRWDGE